MCHLFLYASVLVHVSTLLGVAQAAQYRTYYMDDSPEIHLGKEIRSFAKLIGFRENYTLVENKTFTSRVYVKDAKGVIVTFISQLLESNAPVDEIMLLSKSSNFTFKTQDLIDDERSHVMFGDSIDILYKCIAPIHVKVTFILTAFRSEKCNNIYEFWCKNKLCIWKDLTCDDENNCGDESDEDPLLAHCTAQQIFEFPGVVTIIIVTLILLFLVSLITFFMINNWNLRNDGGTNTNVETAIPDQQDQDQHGISAQSLPRKSINVDGLVDSSAGQNPLAPESKGLADNNASNEKPPCCSGSLPVKEPEKKNGRRSSLG